MKLFLLFGLLLINIVAQDNEFLLPVKKEKLSASKLKELIISSYDNILQLDTDLDELSVELKRVSLKEVKSCINNNNFFAKANKKELKDLLNDLKNLENELNSGIISLRKKLSNLKKTINIK